MGRLPNAFEFHAGVCSFFNSATVRKKGTYSPFVKNIAKLKKMSAQISGTFQRLKRNIVG